MVAWWDGLPLFSQIMYVIAVPSTLILLIQLVLSFFGDNDISDEADVSGIGDSDTDFDDVSNGIDDGDFTPEAAEHAENMDADLSAMRVFTFRGIIAFLCSFAWSALAVFATGAPFFLALIIGFAVGVAMMFAVAKLIHTLLGLAENGTVRFDEALGHVGKVYIPIPAGGSGKIIIAFDGAERECDAENHGDKPLATDTDVRVTGVSGEVLIVEAI
jgi:membrane protein implicated in regulation of membrane protease activity